MRARVGQKSEEREVSVVIGLPGGAGLIHSADKRYEYCLTSDVSSGVGQPVAYQDRYEPGRIDLGDERRLIGGLLPPGAVSADVVDDRGARIRAVVAGGAYAVVLEASDWRWTPPVCCRDALGQPVRRPWAAEYPSERVTDSQESCPACGSADWDEYTPFEDWRGGRGSKVDGCNVMNPIVSCRICGHQEPEGTFFVTSTELVDEDEQERDQRIARSEAEHRRRQWSDAEARLRLAPFPVYGLKGRTGRSGAQSWNDSGLTAATVEYYEDADGDRPQVTVRTDRRLYRGDALEQALITFESLDQTQQPWPEVSNAAKTLWLNARDRERRALALGAVRSDQPLNIDDTSVTAHLLTGNESSWVAAFHYGGAMIVITARDLTPEFVQLERIDGPVTRLLGPDPSHGSGH